jgi:multidrug efflux pump subunit AcrA (membrane-fusion protein)
VQIDVPNSDGLLFAGMYGQVKLSVNSDNPLLVPTTAAVFDAEGTKVAVVDDAGKVHYRRVKLGQDLGVDVEVLEGLDGAETILSNPGQHISEGAVVKAVLRQEKQLPR